VPVIGAAKTSIAILSGKRSSLASGARNLSKIAAAVSSTPVTTAMSVADCSCVTSSGRSVVHFPGKSHREMYASASDSWRCTSSGDDLRRLASRCGGGGEFVVARAPALLLGVENDAVQTHVMRRTSADLIASRSAVAMTPESTSACGGRGQPR
jgi:hypothetical protein